MDCLWQVEEIYPDPLTISQCCGWDMTMDIDSSVCLAGPFTCDDSMCHFSFPTEAWMSGNQTCAATWTAAVEPAGPQFPQPEPEYLSKKACDGSVVRNTFIEVDTAPCSPNMWRCRSQSVPRNLGSDKGPCGDTFVSKPVELNVESKPPTALISPSPFWSPRSRCADNSSSVQETAKSVSSHLTCCFSAGAGAPDWCRAGCHCHYLIVGGGRTPTQLLGHHLGRQSCQWRAWMSSSTRDGSMFWSCFASVVRDTVFSVADGSLAHGKRGIHDHQGEGIDDSTCKVPCDHKAQRNVSWLNSLCSDVRRNIALDFISFRGT